ncbi:hypothetical protein HMPREF9383_1630 [Streptococcus sanguinis SK150]|uniref:Uncharacterized protein n=1 Tax=Streptococcus sanguinis SK150 TaxID=888811 RepID=F0INC7_STRSA|nr:hypothetical protein HMPREF9383_1630 [Streptococcus sanguinis SK150]
MFFKRQKGKYHEVERVTRFKLIKSGKHWLRAATSQFGLFRSMKGGGLSSIELKVTEEQVADKKSGIDFLRGIVATGAVLGGAVVTSTTVHAEEGQALEKVIDTTDVLATRGETVLGEESSAAEAATATASSHTESESVSDTSSASASASVSASISASISVSESMSQSSSASISASTSQAVSDSLSVSESLSVSSSTSDSVSASTSASASASESVSASQTSTASTSESARSESSQQSTEASNQTGRRRTRRDVANAVDTERPVVDFPGEINVYRGESFEFIATATDNSNAFDINKTYVRWYNGTDSGRGTEWIEKTVTQEGNLLKVKVHGKVPVDTDIGHYTRYVMVTDAAGNQNVSNEEFSAALTNKDRILNGQFRIVIRYRPNLPENTVLVNNPSQLSETEKNQVREAIKQSNPNLRPIDVAGKNLDTAISVSNNGTTTITFRDNRKATIQGKDLVDTRAGSTSKSASTSASVSASTSTIASIAESKSASASASTSASSSASISTSVSIKTSASTSASVSASTSASTSAQFLQVPPLRQVRQ